MRRLIVIVALALIIAACGSDEVSDETPAPAGADDAASEPAGPMSVGEAVALPDALVTVRGQLLVSPEGDQVFLCTGLTRSIPPLCAGTRLTVQDLDLDTVELTEMAGIRWTPGAVTLTGEKLGETLVAASVVG